MSAPLDDLMGNALTEPIAEMDGSEESDLVVDVVDDRPEEDQVAPRDPERAGEFNPDEEIEDLGGRAGKRIKQLRYEYHEQRRGKEAAERMREEAVTYAQSMAGQNAQLRELLERGEKVLLTEIKARTEADMGQARDQYKSAYEEGDADAILKAQEALNRSQIEQRAADGYQPLSSEQAVQQWDQQAHQQQSPQAQQPAQQAPDPKLQRWMGDNPWFGKDAEMTSFAYGVHEKLVRQEGVDPRSDSYYQAINNRMREVFPGKFENSTGAEQPAAGSRTSTVVAPARRSSAAPRKVQLTSTQVALARRLGLSPEQYAKQLLKERK